MKRSLLQQFLFAIIGFTVFCWFRLLDVYRESHKNADHPHHYHQILRSNDVINHHQKMESLSFSGSIKQTAAICAVVKDEDPYLEEWLLYHLGIGFAHIYLYDNSKNLTTVAWRMNYKGQDDSDKIISQTTAIPHESDTTSNTRQHAAYRSCMANYGNQHTWIGFIDVDEFIVLYQHDSIVQLLKETCERGSLALHWILFGTSGHKQYVDAPVTLRFQHTTPQHRDFIKTIVRTRDYKDFKNSPHWVALVDDHYRLDTNGEWVELARRQDNPKLFGPKRKVRRTTKFPFDKAAIYHYKYKSVEEFRFKRCQRGDIYNFQLCHKENYDKLPKGGEKDDTAYKLLLKHVPKYQKRHYNMTLLWDAEEMNNNDDSSSSDD